MRLLLLFLVCEVAFGEAVIPPSPYWKNAVSSSSALPASSNPGDCRTAKDTGVIYCWDGSGWQEQSTEAAALAEVASGFLEAPTAKTYTIDEKAAYAYTINNFTGKTASGTLTAAVKINGTSVTGLSAVSVTSSQATTNGTAANSVAAGDRVTLVTSSVSSATDFAFTIKWTRDTAGLVGLVEDFIGFFETPSNKTYTLDEKAAYAYTINSLAVKTASGSITIAVKINGTSVTGLSAVSATSTQSTTSATAANSVATGDRVTLVTTSNSSTADLAFTLKVTR